MIDILVPVLSRPQNVIPLVNSIEAAASVPYAILFLCSSGDKEEIVACRATTAKTKVVPWEAGASDYAKKMNLGYSMTSNEFILLGSDDISFQTGWDTEALSLAKTGVHVVGTNDKAHPLVKKGRFSTHPLIRRSYVDEFGASADGAGCLVHEGYDHNFTDREICHLAQFRGAWAFAHNSIINHRHPSWRTAPDDDTYRKPRKTVRQDQKLFYERCALWEYAGLNPQEASNARRFRFSAQRRALRA